MRTYLLSSACLAWAALAFADEKKEDRPTVEVASVAVAHKVDAKVADQFEFGLPNRTEVRLLLRHAGKPLLGLGEASKLTALKDDKGNSLLDKSSEEKSLTWDAALDRSAVLASIQAKASPGKGATRVLIKGELVLVHGADEKTEQKEKFAFTQGSKTKLGKFDVRVSREKTLRGGPEIEVTSESLAFNVVKSVRVTDADGKAVEVVAERNFGSGKWVARYSLRAPLKEGKLVVAYYARAEEVKVPLELSVGLAD